MNEFLTQTMERRRKSLQLEAKPPSENAESMDISKEFLEVVALSFEVKDLSENNVCSEGDQIIRRLKSSVNKLFDVVNTQADVKFDDMVTLAVAYYNLGQMYNNSNNLFNLHTASSYLETCLQLLRKKELERKAILTSIGALNEISSIKLDKDTYTFSKTAMLLYLDYTKEDNYPDPIHIPTIIGIKEREFNPRIILEKLHCTTLEIIATQYCNQPEDKHEFIKYVYGLLKEQLSQMTGRQLREDCIDCILTLFDMSKYFLINNRFVEARSYLATADYITRRFSEENLKTIRQQENDVSKVRSIYMSDNCDFIRGVSARSWGTYGVSLSRYWLERFLRNKDTGCEIEKAETKSCMESINLLIFSDVIEEANCINQITYTRISNFTDAKSIVAEILERFETAKIYFTADADIENHAQIVLEISAAYKYLAGFSHCRDIQLKLHKMRVKCLKDVCKKFHTIIDTNSELLTYKRVWYEVVTSCATIMDLMFEETYHNVSQTMSKDVDKFAKLISKNIDLYLHV